MKTASSALKTHLAGELTTVSTCVLITRTDGVVFAFTDHDQPLVIGGVTYQPALSFSRTAIRSTSDNSVDNLEAEGVLDAAAITDSDLQAGKFDDATILLFLVNWADLSQGTMTLRRGQLGKVTLQQNRYQAEVRGLMQFLNTTVGETYQPTCRADLYDSRCKVAITDGVTRFADSVASVTSARVFVASTLANPGPVVKTYTASTISFHKNRTVSDSANGFVAAGFAPNDAIEVTGSAKNDRPILAASVAAGTITTGPTDTGILNEPAGNPITLKSTVLGFFDLGYVVWLTGANAGLKSEVLSWSGPSAKIVTLWMAPPYAIAPGDTFQILAGCDHRVQTCAFKFANVLNFRGEPTVPGQDPLWQYPNATG